MTARLSLPDDFLSLAKKMVSLEKNLDGEALIRTIMNRCYYAVYLALRQKLGLPPDTNHRTVYEEIKKRNVKLATYLDFLWACRRGADYYLQNPVKIRGWQIGFIVSFEISKAIRCINIAQSALIEAK